MGAVWWPWPSGHSYPGQVWDITVQRHVVESASQGAQWSPDTHQCVSVDRAQAARVNTLRAAAMWEALDGHLQRAMLAHGARWGFLP